MSSSESDVSSSISEFGSGFRLWPRKASPRLLVGSLRTWQTRARVESLEHPYPFRPFLRNVVQAVARCQIISVCLCQNPFWDGIWMKILVQSSLKLKGTHKYQVLSYPNTFTLMTWDWFVMFGPWFLCHQWTCFCDVASITYVVCIVHSSQIILYEPRSVGLSVHLHTVFRNFGCLQVGQAKHKVDVTWTCKIWKTERLSCLCISRK